MNMTILRNILGVAAACCVFQLVNSEDYHSIIKQTATETQTPDSVTSYVGWAFENGSSLDVLQRMLLFSYGLGTTRSSIDLKDVCKFWNKLNENLTAGTDSWVKTRSTLKSGLNEFFGVGNGGNCGSGGALEKITVAPGKNGSKDVCFHLNRSVTFSSGGRMYVIKPQGGMACTAITVDSIEQAKSVVREYEETKLKRGNVKPQQVSEARTKADSYKWIGFKPIAGKGAVTIKEGMGKAEFKSGVIGRGSRGGISISVLDGSMLGFHGSVGQAD